MAGRLTAVRSRKKVLLSTPPKTDILPPPPRLDTPPLSFAKKRSDYALQRDYKVLVREKKVSTALEDGVFRTRLENILQGQLENKHRPKHTLPNPDQWLLDHSSRMLEQEHRGPRQQVTVASGVVIPINDLCGNHAAKYTLAERQTRCKLAAVYRLVDMFGWNQLIYNHITACAPGEAGGYFINAFGLMYHEVTASNLVRVSFQGEIVEAGSTQLGVNRPGLVLHSAIHRARSDIKCVIHIHNVETVAISVVNCGLLPSLSEAAAIGSVSYFDSWEVEREDVMENEIIRTLGSSKVLFLHNHGAMAVGGTIEEAFSIAHNLVKACRIQVAAMSAGLGNIGQEQHGVWSRHKGDLQPWKPGEIEFEALMRLLDSKGYKTGYNYKNLDLLQPGRVKEPMKTTTSQDDLLEKEKTEKPSINSRNPTISGGKNEVPAASSILHASLRERELDVSDNSNGSHTQDMSTEEENRLNSLQKMAEQVAKSTSNSLQKVSQSPLELAQRVAEQVAKSTGESLQKLTNNQEETISSQQAATDGAESAGGANQEAMEGLNSLEMAQQTAERVARSTCDAVEKLTVGKMDDLPPLELTAQRVARSTGDAVAKRVAPEHDNNDVFHTERDDEKRAESQQTYSTDDLLPPQPNSLHLATAQTVTESTGIAFASRVPNGTHNSLHVRYIAPILSPQADDSIRKLPALPPGPWPPVMEQFVVSDNTRKLPMAPVFSLAGRHLRPQRLSNGYQRSPESHKIKRSTSEWTRSRSIDSDSEYSTTESVGFSQSATPVDKRTFSNSIDGSMHDKEAAGSLDLETTPSERMTQTAEMVAESTGRAMHKLTITLPEY